MTAAQPALVGTADKSPPATRVAARTDHVGSWRYAATRTPRLVLVLAALISVGFHAGILFGIRPEKKPPIVAKKDTTQMLLLTMPDLKELEEPEPLPTDEPQNPTDMATLVPMQADLPQIPRPSDFVQQVNFTSLIEKPDFSKMNVTVIPGTFRGGRALAESIGKIFSLADLDRHPEPVLQQAPLYPLGLKREGVSGVVRVQFVVDTEGRVVDAQAVESTHSGFEEAAVNAVLKWRFRPGYRNHRKVNTRMAVPIVFELEEAKP